MITTERSQRDISMYLSLTPSVDIEIHGMGPTLMLKRFPYKLPGLVTGEQPLRVALGSDDGISPYASLVEPH